jgi:hypothetical protein
MRFSQLRSVPRLSRSTAASAADVSDAVRGGAGEDDENLDELLQALQHNMDDLTALAKAAVEYARNGAANIIRRRKSRKR